MDLQRQIEIKNAYLQLIIDLGFDYDGCETIEGLKFLIDELCTYAKMAINNDDKTVIYISGKDNIEDNILMERISE